MALPDNPEAAASHFREVISVAPKSQLASLSAAWLKTLEAPSNREEQEIATQTSEWLLLELLRREHMLTHEVNVRDKKLEELSRQLNALKQITLEMKEKGYLINPRTRTVPESDTTN